MEQSRVDIYGGGEISSGISKFNHSAGIIVDLVQVEIVTNKNNYEIQLIPWVILHNKVKCVWVEYREDK